MGIKIERALISVSDKSGLDVLVKTLHSLGVEIISTGGTSDFIRSKGIDVVDVSSYTDFPEMMGGRVKTLHPRVHAGILADRADDGHIKQLAESNIPLIDMVVVNLYPFEKTVADNDVKLDDAVENIDIGGPTMLRAAAKNFKYVAGISSPMQYPALISELKSRKGYLSCDTLMKLAGSVFALTGGYDAVIGEYLSSLSDSIQTSRDSAGELPPGGGLPDRIAINLNKALDLRYGENPDQRGAFYFTSGADAGWVSKDSLLQGKELSFNNIMDLGAALDIVLDFEKPACTVIKHNNPSGASADETLKGSFINALDCDRMSAFGGIIGLNRLVDEDLARTILSEAGFFECLIAPGYDKKALEVLSAKKNVRVIKYSPEHMGASQGKDIKKVRGGFLVQDADESESDFSGFRVVTQKKPDEKEMQGLLFAWKIARFVKSNAIVLAHGTRTVGIGAGQMSRVDSVDVSISKAGGRARGSVMASDAFFPKTDSIFKARAAGITAVIQPGGSIRDKEVIEACDETGLSMVFTYRRHFRH